jgi:hypothetical protein
VCVRARVCACVCVCMCGCVVVIVCLPACVGAWYLLGMLPSLQLELALAFAHERLGLLELSSSVLHLHALTAPRYPRGRPDYPRGPTRLPTGPTRLLHLHALTAPSYPRGPLPWR